MKRFFNPKAIIKMSLLFTLLILITLPNHAFADSTIKSNSNASKLPKSIDFEKNKDVSIRSLNAIISGANLFVAVGDNGIIRTSVDGQVWITRNSGTDENLQAIVWNGKKFVAVGEKSSILISNDGINWEKPTITSGYVSRIINGNDTDMHYILDADFYGIAWNGNKFVAVGRRGEIWNSVDGYIWEMSYSQSIADLFEKHILNNGGLYLYKIIYNGNSFTAFGVNQGDNTNLILNSKDGEDWVVLYQKSANDSGMTTIKDIIWDGIKYIVSYGNSKFMVSTDGYKWNMINSDLPTNCYKLAYQNKKYIAMKRDSNTQYYSSSNLKNWTSVNQCDNQYEGSSSNDFLLKNDIYLAIGQQSDIYISRNGINKKLQFGITNSSLNTGCYYNGIYVAAGEGDILYSTDGQKWNKSNAQGDYKSLIHVNDSFIAVGGRSIAISQDGVNWTNEWLAYSVNKITYGNGNYIAVGDNGLILKSADLKSWNQINTDTKENINSVIFTGNYFYAVGKNNTLIKSSDGIKWTQISISQFENNKGNIDFNDILWDGTKFITVGSKICTSEDGEHWVNRTLDSRSNLYLTSITYFNGYYIASELFGSVMLSLDGVNWKTYLHRGDVTNQVFHDDKSFFALANNGGIIKLDFVEEAEKIDSGWKNNRELTQFDLRGIATNSSGRLVAVGMYGIIRTSTNGTDWKVIESGTRETLNTIKYFNNKFFVPTANGIILTSPNGLDWSKVNTGSTSDIQDIEYNGSVFVAVGTNGCIITSKDGLVWSTRTNGTIGGLDLGSVSYFKNKFYVFGKEWYGRAFSSSDGLNWSDISGFNQGSDTKYNDILYKSAYNKDTIVVSTVGGLITSKNGSDWKFIPLECDFRVFYTGQYFIVYGNYERFYSYDGYTWKSEANDSLSPNAIVKYNNKLFGVRDIIAYSTDARKWTNVSLSTIQKFNDIIWGDGKYVTVGNSGNILVSNDGDNWKNVKNTGTRYGILSIDWNGERYVAGSYFGLILTSKTGSDWTSVYFDDSSAKVVGVKWVRDRFYAITNDGKIYSSPDSFQWTKVYDDKQYYIQQGFMGNSKNKLIAFGTIYIGGMTNKTKVLTSSDGVKWKEALIDYEITNITCKNDTFYALTRNCKVLTSSDGTKWKEISTINYYDEFGYHLVDYYTKILWDGNQFSVVCNKKEMTSPDAISWNIKENLGDVMVIPRNIAWNGSSYVSAGECTAIAKKVVTKESKAASLNIFGESYVPIKSKNSTYQFKAKVFDQYSKEMIGKKINWTIITSIKNVTINKASGILSIPSNSTSGRVLVRAEVDGSTHAFATKTIYLGAKPIISVNKTNLNLYPGQSYKLSAINLSTSTVKWDSSNNSILTVDSTGNIKALTTGNAVVTLTLEKGAYEATCMVKVSKKIEVTFNTNGGVKLPTQNVASDNTVVKPTNPTKLGYTFLGWYQESTLKTKWNFELNKVTKNTTIYAKWAKNPSVPTKISIVKLSANNAKISWSKLKDAKAYEIYRATSNNGPYTLITTSTGENYTNHSLAKGKTYYYKIRAYKMADNQKIYSSYTSIIKIKI